MEEISFKRHLHRLKQIRARKAGMTPLGAVMNDLQTFASIGIVAAIVATLSIPQATRAAPFSATSMFALVFGVLVSSAGFLVLNTDWHGPGAWRSGVLIVIGGLLACHMMKRCTQHDWQSGE